MFLARVKAGERGAKRIDVEHFFLGLVIEDQGAFEEHLTSLFGAEPGAISHPAPRHVPYFQPAIASRLISEIEAQLPQSRPVDTSKEIPASPALEHAIALARTFRAETRRNEIVPLHLLAAILADKSSPSAELLHGAGSSLEKVLEEARQSSDVL